MGPYCASGPTAVLPTTCGDRELPAGNGGPRPWTPPRAQRRLDEVLPADGPTYPRTFDLLILDEAHHVAPAAPKQVYAIDSRQTKLIRRLAPHFTHRLFLSATPHNGYQASFTALLEILDDQRFARGMPLSDDAVRDPL